MQTSLHIDSDLVRDLERVRFVSGNFENLQGLRTAWYGLAALISGLAYPIFGYLFRARPDREYLPGLFEYCLVWLIITASYFGLPGLQDWYRKKFGVIQTKRIPLTWPKLVMITFLIADHLHLPQGQSVYVAVGLSWFLVGLWRPQTDRLALGLGILAVGALQSFLPSMVGSVITSLIVCGAASFVAGLLDHRLLVDTLGSAPASEAELEGAEATEIQPR